MKKPPFLRKVTATLVASLIVLEGMAACGAKPDPALGCFNMEKPDGSPHGAAVAFVNSVAEWEVYNNVESFPQFRTVVGDPNQHLKAFLAYNPNLKKSIWQVEHPDLDVFLIAAWFWQNGDKIREKPESRKWFVQRSRRDRPESHRNSSEPEDGLVVSG